MKERLVELRATIADKDLERVRHKRSLRGWVAVGVVLAFAWIPSDVSLTPSVLDYGTIEVGTTSGFTSLKLTNRTSQELRPFVRIEGAADFRADSSSCMTVRRGESCLLRVEFRPHKPGKMAAKVIVSLTPDKNLTAELRGAAIGQESPPLHGPPVVPKAIIKIEPAILDFSSQPTQAQQIDIVNEGNATLHITTCVQGANRDRFEEVEAGGCNTRLDVRPRDHRIVAVRYKAKMFAWKGTYSAVLQVDHDASNIPSPQDVSLRWARVLTRPVRPLPTRQNPQSATLTINMRADPSCEAAQGSVAYESGSKCTIADKKCSVRVAKQTIVSLRAIPSPGTNFGSFSGACSGTNPCTLTMTYDQSVTATFCGLIP